MHYVCPSCDERFEQYSDAAEHPNQVFTVSDDGGVIDIALPPSHPEVSTSILHRGWWLQRIQQLRARLK